MEPTIKCGRHLAEHADLSGSRFHDVNLSGAEFDDVNMSKARFHNMNLSDRWNDDRRNPGCRHDGGLQKAEETTFLRAGRRPGPVPHVRGP
jgi:hypothetical protein